jgi:ABC-type bacteriocin/lantibiotic exporter with double-glycine peptidase domain
VRRGTLFVVVVVVVVVYVIISFLQVPTFRKMNDDEYFAFI